MAVGLWPGPRTYTGQPLAEIHATGSPPLLRQILAHCLARGARLAEPGEFTLRAFLSGRIDLTQSEAVLGVIDARSPAQLDAALRQLAGGLASPIAGLRDRLADVLAHLEANLDFAEEPDVDPLGREALADSLDEAAAEVDRLADRLRGRDRADGRPRVVLVGPPNAGKSRLFNALLGLDRAIVSPVAGTTRDYLEAPCDCDGLAVDLVDTAGLEAARGPIEGRAQAARGGQSAVGRPPARLPVGRRRAAGARAPADRPEARRLDQGRRLAPARPAGPDRHQRLDRRGARRPPAGDRRGRSGRRTPPPTCPPGPPPAAASRSGRRRARSRAAAETLRARGRRRAGRRRPPPGPRRPRPGRRRRRHRRPARPDLPAVLHRQVSRVFFCQGGVRRFIDRPGGEIRRFSASIRRHSSAVISSRYSRMNRPAQAGDHPGDARRELTARRGLD